LVIASLVDAGTMTADFTRFSRNGRQAVVATLAAFPVGQVVSALIGILVVSAGFAVEPAVNGGMFVGILAAEGSPWSTLTAAFVVLNLAAVCSHCLYNGAMGWSQAPATRAAPTCCTPSSCGSGSPGANATGWTRWSGSSEPMSSCPSASSATVG